MLGSLDAKSLPRHFTAPGGGLVLQPAIQPLANLWTGLRRSSTLCRGFELCRREVLNLWKREFILEPSLKPKKQLEKDRQLWLLLLRACRNQSSGRFNFTGGFVKVHGVFICIHGK